MTDGEYTLDTTYNDQLRSPMNLALHWSEDALCWEVIVRYRGRRLGVTQVRNLDDLGQTVLDYLTIASSEALPSGALASSLHPKDYHVILGQVRAAIVQFGQLDRSNQTTALETIEQIDVLLDDVPVGPPADVEELAQEIVHNIVCPCSDLTGMDTYPCPNAATIGTLIERLHDAGVLRRATTSDGV